MRFLVFLLGFVASLIVGAAGWFWIDYQSNRLIRNTLYDDHKIDIGIIMPDYTDFETTSWAAVFLLVGGALGWVVIAVWTVVLARLAAWAYRRDTKRV